MLPPEAAVKYTTSLPFSIATAVVPSTNDKLCITGVSRFCHILPPTELTSMPLGCLASAPEPLEPPTLVASALAGSNAYGPVMRELVSLTFNMKPAPALNDAPPKVSMRSATGR